jgi:SAM-dependent methyltransferase
MPRMPAEHVNKNRRFWDAGSDDYQARHGEVLTRTALAWGPWRVPEAELNVLGDVRGKDVLELGCGAAQWSIALADLEARPVGIDLSSRQLDHAREAVRRAGARVPLVHASAEELPFGDESFDVVFCDHGAMSFADPRATVPEAARVLRPGGLLAFAHESPFRFVCWDPETEVTGRTLHGEYFEMRSYEDETSASFQLPYGEWLALFQRSGFRVEDLIEPRPAPDAATTYEDWDPEWCHRWPGENIWRVRKEGTAPRPSLVGVAEAARLLGWDKRRVSTYVRRGSFPEPVASLAGGRVWDERDVAAFADAFRARIRSRRRRSD